MGWRRWLCSFSKPSVASPTSQLILLIIQPFCCFTYITTCSPTLLLLHLRHMWITYVTWRAAHKPDPPRTKSRYATGSRVHNYLIRNSIYIYIGRCKYSRIQNSFEIASLNLFNSLPNNIKIYHCYYLRGQLVLQCYLILCTLLLN